MIVSHGEHGVHGGDYYLFRTESTEYTEEITICFARRARRVSHGVNGEMYLFFSRRDAETQFEFDNL